MAKKALSGGTRSGDRAKLSAEHLEMKTVITTTFRCHDDLREDYIDIIRWCSNPKHPSSFSSVINSLLPAIRYTLNNNTFIEDETGRRYLRADFGDVLLREPHLPNT